MEINDFANYTEACFQGTPAPCMSVCPLKVDVRAVIENVQNGNFSAAYRLYRNQVVFPGIVSRICHQPCQLVCLRNQSDLSIELRKIEMACVAYTNKRDPISFNAPKKNKRVAIIGAGLSGMACANKLVSRNYEVMVYEKEAFPGGALKKTLPQEVILAEFELEFKHARFNLIPSREIVDLSEIEADAIYIATGKNGRTFGLEPDMNRDSLGSQQQGVFLGGELIGSDPITAIEHGVRVSHSIEKYLKVNLMDGVPSTYLKDEVEEKYLKLKISDPLFPEAIDGVMTSEQAISEAKRCLKCDCNICVNSCEMMQHFKKKPLRITQDVMATMRPVEQFSKRIASRLINSCNQCGLCETVCPESIDMEEELLKARHFLFKDKAMPAAYHDFWMRDMAFANSDEAYIFMTPEQKIKSKYLFFPGCQLGASAPGYVTAAFEFIKKLDHYASILVGCCGVPADWAGDEALRDQVHAQIASQWKEAGEPLVVLACPTCKKTFSQYLPDIKTISLYQVMALNPDPRWKYDDEKNVVAIFDPCASRYDQPMQKSVRSLLTTIGYQVEELSDQGELAKCCSYGGHIQAVNPGLKQKIVTDRLNQANYPYVTYCSNCRDTFASDGKESDHLLNLILDLGIESTAVVSLSQRWQNRIALKNSLTGSVADTKTVELATSEQAIPKSAPRLVISPELRKVMNAQLIMDEDVMAVISNGETTGNLIINQVNSDVTAHLTRGLITYWVTYQKLSDGYELKNVYAHRMKIADEFSNPAAK